MKDRYREYIIRISKYLEIVLEDLRQNITNLAVSGGYSDFSTLEAIKLSLEDFENIDDINIKVCIDLYYQIENAYESLMNINAITKEEVDSFDIEAFDTKCRIEAYEKEEKKKKNCNDIESTIFGMPLSDFLNLPDDTLF